jgi:flagellin-specific chaperone FliS
MVSSGISKTLAIITEFSNTLNHEIGGEIAEDLDALYGFMIRELSMANIKQSKEKLLVVEKLLTDLRATWGEAVDINRREKAEESVTQADPATVVQVSPEKTHEIEKPATFPPRQPHAIPAVPENYVPFSVSS